MKRLLLLLLITMAPGLAGAVICKTVGADGVVSYSDVPAADCQQALELPDYSRYAPREPIAQPVWPTRPTAVAVQAYQSLTIVDPPEDGTVRDNSGNFTVTLQIEPALHRGHRVHLLLNGIPVGSGFDQTSIAVSGVDRGTHLLRARVEDSRGNLLIESAERSFTLRQASLLDPQRKKPPPPPPPPASKPPPAAAPPPAPKPASN